MPRDAKWDKLQQVRTVEMRPYEPGESMKGVKINKGERPKKGDYIAREIDDRSNMWYVSYDDFIAEKWEPNE